MRMEGYTARRRVSRGVGRNGELRFVGSVVVDAGLLGAAEAAPLTLLLPAIWASRDLRERWSSAIMAKVFEAWNTYKNYEDKKETENKEI
ncbi:hypothetical protein E0Z10_g6486 [Xylaria hypoxylon]|uniref:Uncharacterized protein n=1 Tax=Xylaria hypoxylon TaxID=37992 RepID=A0A4Z0YE70_9PEZI|nr:hypothetical protein E0Z10_g6486 [Xylaria hypoxylon]